MCGIYGMAKSPTPYTKKQLKLVKKVLREIAIDSETRGTHSSGIASVGNEVEIHKSLLKSSKFVNSNGYSKAVKSLADDTRILMGHTRFATAGAVTVSNAHPFKVGNTVGAHNGCIYNQAEMEKKLDKVCPVDSQLFFKAIDNASSIQDAVKHFDSDFALSFVKDNPTVLHLCREENRPLHFTYVRELKTLFYASESDFISDAFDKYGMDVDVSQLNKNILYSFDTSKFDGLITNVSKTKFEYDSRQYHYGINTYVNRANVNQNYYYGNTWYRDGQDEQPEYEDGAIDLQWMSDTKEELAELYDTDSWQWFYDETLQQWFYTDGKDGNVLSEDEFVAENYDALSSDVDCGCNNCHECHYGNDNEEDDADNNKQITLWR